MNVAAARPYLWSLGLHVAIGALLVVGISFSRPEPVQPVPISAVVVDRAVLAALAQQQRVDQQQAQAAARVAAERAAAEQARLEQEQQAAQKAAAEQQARQAARQQAAVAAADAARRKAQQQAAARKAQEQAEARRKADAQAAAAKRQAQAEARDRAQREADLRASLAAEEQHSAAVSSGLRGQYVALLKARIERNWIRPASARPGLKCTVHITQIPGGEVVNASLGDCNGDEAVKQSILSAVLRASPLPAPPDPSLFERNLDFVFEPKD